MDTKTMIKNLILLSTIVSTIAFAGGPECFSFYAVEKMAMELLQEANGSKTEAFKLLQIPRYAAKIVAAKKSDPDFVKKLKLAVNELSTRPLLTRPIIKDKPTEQDPVDTYAEEQLEIFRQRRKKSESKVPLRKGAFSKTDLRSLDIVGGTLELLDGDLLAFRSVDIKRMTPVVDASGKISYKQVSYLNTNSLGLNIRGMGQTLSSGMVASIEGHSNRRIIFIDPNNLNPQNFKYGRLNGFIGYSLVELIDQQIAVLGDNGEFVIHRQADSVNQESVSAPYRPTTHNQNGTMTTISRIEVLPNGDFLAAYVHKPDIRIKPVQLTETSTIQHWIRNIDGSYRAGKEFQSGSYTAPQRQSGIAKIASMRTAAQSELLGMKLINPTTLVTGEARGVVTVWNWDQILGELTPVSYEVPSTTSVGTGIPTYGKISGIYLLASGELLITLSSGNLTQESLFTVDAKNQLVPTIRIPGIDSPAARVRGHVTVLSHGGFISDSIEHTWLWTRSP